MLKVVSNFVNAIGALNYKGTWNASTNTPTLASGVGTKGDYYVVSVAGTTNLDGQTSWGVGDWAAFNGTVWQKVDGGSTGDLTTLNVTGSTYLASTSGSVGIGTSSPGQKLTVSAGSVLIDNGRYYYGKNAAGTSIRLLGVNAGNVNYIGAIDAGPTDAIYGAASSFTTQAWYIGGSEKMRLDGTGLGVGTSPNASAIFDAQSTTKGVRFPNMTTAEKNAIASPAAGLVVFDTTLAKLCVYSGAAWQTITSV